MVPIRAEAKTATLAGPPGVADQAQGDVGEQADQPARSRNEPNKMNRKM